MVFKTVVLLCNKSASPSSPVCCGKMGDQTKDGARCGFQQHVGIGPGQCLHTTQSGRSRGGGRNDGRHSNCNQSTSTDKQGLLQQSRGVCGGQRAASGANTNGTYRVVKGLPALIEPLPHRPQRSTALAWNNCIHSNLTASALLPASCSSPILRNISMRSTRMVAQRRGSPRHSSPAWIRQGFRALRAKIEALAA